MIALAFVAGCFFGVLVGVAVCGLCRAAGPSGFERDLEDIRALPEVRHG